MAKPTVVIVPTAWQTPAVWQGFSDDLQNAGYDSEYVKLPSVGGTEAPLAGLEEDVAAVRSVLANLKEQDKKALLLCHSFGGLAGSHAVSGLDASGIVYLSGFVVPNGKSILDTLDGKQPSWLSIEDDRMIPMEDKLQETIFNDMEDDAHVPWMKETTHSSAAVLDAKASHEPWTDGTPCGYIFCTDDNVLPFPAQQRMVARLGPDAVFYVVSSGHCPQISASKDLVKAVRAVEQRLAKRANGA